MGVFSKGTQLYRALSTLPNVVGVGRGSKLVRGKTTGEPALVVLVTHKEPYYRLGRRDSIPRKIDGLTTDVIEIGEVRLLGRTGLERPAAPGMSIGHYKISAGTFGAVVKDRETGELLILSNNHVLANITDGQDRRAKQGDPILQPGKYDGGRDEDVIGYLERFIPLHRQVGFPTCSVAGAAVKAANAFLRLVRPHYHVQLLKETGKVNRVDAALARPVSPEAITDEILEIGKVRGVMAPEINMKVRKSGRSTGLTESRILVVEATLRVAMEGPESAVFEEQIIAGPMSQPGDSGSLVVTEDNYAVGLLFAGSDKATIFNRIDFVLEALNVTF